MKDKLFLVLYVKFVFSNKFNGHFQLNKFLV